MKYQTLPIPAHFNRDTVGQLWQVKYQERALQARQLAKQYGIKPAATDQKEIYVLGIDLQNAFCLPSGELYVAGRSGTGAVDDNIRLCEFIYRNLGVITKIHATLDTHTAIQIFHEVFFIDENGNHPASHSQISTSDIRSGKLRVNPAIARIVANGNYAWLQRYVQHYVDALERAGKYQLTIWPYHVILGGVGHALVPAVEEAFWWHNQARISQTGFEIKGGNPLTENYSILRPEVLEDQNGNAIAQKNARFIKILLNASAIFVAGQAKSHCFAWTVDDLLNEIMIYDPSLVRKVYLLEDCTSPVVVPGIVDYTDDADAAIERFRSAGMNVIRSTDPIEDYI